MKIKFKTIRNRFSPSPRKLRQKVEKAIAREIENMLKSNLLPAFNNSNFKNTLFGKEKYLKLLQMAREFSSSIYMTIYSNVHIPVEWPIFFVSDELLENIRNKLPPFTIRARSRISDNNTLALTPEDHNTIHNLFAPLTNNWQNMIEDNL